MKKTLRILLISSVIIVMSLTCFTACDVEDVFDEIGDFAEDVFNSIEGDNEDIIGGNEGEYVGSCEHDWYVEYSYPSTCTSYGYEEYRCKLCGEYRKESLPLGEHEEIVVEGTPATCYNSGWTDRIDCDSCGKTIQDAEYIEPKGHTVVTLDAVPATCTENGLTEGKGCSECGEILEQYTVYASHTPEVVEGYEATCTENGLSDGSVCSVCDEVLQIQYVIDAGHSEEYIQQVDPTCTEDGHTEGSKCSRCGEYIDEPEVIPAEGHKEYVSQTGYDATCTEDGKTDTISCSECYQVISDGQTIPAGHKEEAVAGVAATCSSTGLTEGKKCSVCGEITLEQDVIAKLLHTMVDVSGYAATCSSNGLSAGRACSVCGTPAVTQHTIMATGHVFGDDGKCTGCDIEITQGLEYTADETSGKLTYIVSGFIDGYGVDIEIIVIPSSYEGAPVVGIAEGAFEGYQTLKEVVLPETIVSIGNNAFNGCSSLEFIECTDFAQSEQWGDTWFGDCTTVKVKAPSYNGKTPFSVYNEAMNSVNHNINRFVMSTKGTTYITYGSQTVKALEQYTVQQQYYNDFYYYKRQTDYMSSPANTTEEEQYYVDEYIYIPSSYENQKYHYSLEACYAILMLDREDMPELTEKYFKNIVFSRSSDGKMYLTIDLDEELMTAFFLEMMDMDEGMQISDISYEYEFDANGNLLNYDCDMVYTMGGNTSYIFNAVSTVTFSEVGTFSGVSAPYGYTDYTEYLTNRCKYGHTVVECPGVAPNCFSDGRTAYSYCSVCFHAINEFTVLSASHNYENGECTECGAFEDEVSEKLAYELNEAGTGYVLVGIGDCEDVIITVPEQVYGLPVVKVNADAFEETDVAQIRIGDALYSVDEFNGWEIE